MLPRHSWGKHVFVRKRLVKGNKTKQNKKAYLGRICLFLSGIRHSLRFFSSTRRNNDIFFFKLKTINV
jgi:hypothetical protein